MGFLLGHGLADSDPDVREQMVAAGARDMTLPALRA